jgi:flagellar FliJ protein
MAFRFRLETLLRIKRRLEEAAQMELSGLSAKKAEMEQRQRELLDELNSLRGQLKEGLKQGLNASEYQLCQQALSVKTNELDRLRQDISKIELEIIKARHKLTGIYRERKLAENLRKRQFDEYRRQEARAEQNELDDLMGLRLPNSSHQIG